MQRRTFLQVGAIGATLLALPHQVAHAVGNLAKTVKSALEWKDYNRFFLIGMPEENYSRAFMRAEIADIRKILAENSARTKDGLVWIKVPAVPDLMNEGQYRPGGGQALQFCAHVICLFDKGSWQHDVKVIPDEYEINVNMLTTKYRHVAYSSLDGTFTVL